MKPMQNPKGVRVDLAPFVFGDLTISDGNTPIVTCAVEPRRKGKQVFYTFDVAAQIDAVLQARAGLSGRSSFRCC